MKERIGGITILNNRHFQIKLSDVEITDNGYIFGNLILIINDKILGDISSIDLINATTLLDLCLTLIRNDSYTPKVKDEFFYSDKEYILNNAFFPFVENHDYQAIKNLLLDEKGSFNTIFGGGTALEMVSGFILQSENQDKLRFVWKNELKGEVLVNDETISHKDYYLTIISFLGEIENLIEKYSLVNSNKEVLKDIRLKYKI